jgi:hypothetical protein
MSLQITMASRKLLAESFQNGSTRQELASLYLRLRYAEELVVAMEVRYYDDAYNGSEVGSINVTAFNRSTAMVTAMNNTRNMTFGLPTTPTDVERCFICCCQANTWEYNTVCMAKRRVPTFCRGGTRDALMCDDANVCPDGECSTSHPYIVTYESKFA